MATQFAWPPLAYQLDNPAGSSRRRQSAHPFPSQDGDNSPRRRLNRQQQRLTPPRQQRLQRTLPAPGPARPAELLARDHQLGMVILPVIQPRPVRLVV